MRYQYIYFISSFYIIYFRTGWIFGSLREKEKIWGQNKNKKKYHKSCAIKWRFKLRCWVFHKTHKQKEDQMIFAIYYDSFIFLLDSLFFYFLVVDKTNKISQYIFYWIKKMKIKFFYFFIFRLKSENKNIKM